MTYEIETVECDRCHDNVPSVETFLNADDEVLCNECSMTSRQECVECTELRRLLAQWVTENKRLKLTLEECIVQSDPPQRPDHPQKTEGSSDQNERVAHKDTLGE